MAVFTLAKELGMTATEMTEKMPYSEFSKWVMYMNQSSEKSEPDELAPTDFAGLL